jgi:glycosyltransferase involved in cell wall biosynthesis
VTSSSPGFALVIPCYNESRGLAELVARARFTAEQGAGEVILVDNGSTDDSPEVFRELLGEPDAPDAVGQVRWTRVEVNEGYGFGILSGLEMTTAPVVGWTHADLQTDPADALRAMAEFEDTGPRVFVKGKRYGRRAFDRFFTAGMSVFESVLLRTTLRDINAQPTMFHRDLIDIWGTAPKDFSLDLFAVYRARRAGFRIRRIPVIFAPRKWGTSTWNTDMSAKRRFIRRTIDYSLQLRKSL